MGNECRFDFNRPHVDTADLEHVVGPARVDVKTFAVDRVLVPPAAPGPLECVAALRAIGPVRDRARRSGDLQFAHLPLRNRMAIVAQNPKLIPWHRRAAGPVAYVPGAIRKEDMQHFRGTQAVEDLDAKMVGPTLSDIRGECLAGGSAAAQSEFVASWEVRARQQRSEQGRHAVKNRRLVLFEPREDSWG